MTKCVYCGCKEFYIEDGAHTCVECGSHQINFVELVDGETAWDLNRSRFYINPDGSKRDHMKKIVDIPLSWSYYEAYNKILKQWTDILVQLGASKKYQETVFKLWVCYLQKRNIAFKQDIPEDKRGGDGLFDRRDVATIKGAIIETNERIKIKEGKKKKEKGSLEVVKNKVEKEKILRSNTNKNMSCVVACQMNETLKSIKAFEEEEMEIDEDMDESHYESKIFMGEESILSDVTDEEEEEDEETGCENDKSQNSEKLVINMTRKRRMEFSETYKFNFDFLVVSPLYLNLPKLISFLYLGALMSEEEILLMDMLRWCREDFIPYQSAAYVLPKSMLKDIDDENVFNRPVPHAEEVRFHCGSMALYLSLQYLPLHSIKLVINKIIDTLKLPDDVRDLGLLTLKSVLFTRHSVISVPPVEATAAAAIILVLKVTFGMDNFHEEKLSDFADTFNRIFKSKGKEYRVFSWRKWHKLINSTRHLVEQVGVGINSYSRADEHKVPVDTKRLIHYFWSKGMWKTPIGKDNLGEGDRWDTHLLKSTLGLNLQTLKGVLNVNYAYKPYHIRYWGIVKQYIHEAACEDVGRDKKKLLEIANKLDQTSFSSHRFNWLLHRYEIIAEFLTLKREIDIVRIPTCSPKKAKKIVSKSREKKYTDIFYVPDPLKSFWSARDKSLKDCPSNFQWLVRVMSEICETTEEDIYTQYLRQEMKYLFAIDIRGKNKTLEKINFAEGEDVRDL